MASKERVEAIVEFVHGRASLPSGPDVNVAELAEAYEKIHKLEGKAPNLTVLSFGDRLAVRFPQLNSPIVFVSVGPGQKPREALIGVPDWQLDWLGPKESPESYRHFLVAEITGGWTFLLLTLSCALIALGFAATPRTLQSVNQLGVASVTIFLSMFVLFVIGESAKHSVDFEMYRTGRLHAFLTADKHMTSLAVTALGVGFANIVILNSEIQLRIGGWALPRTSFWGVIGTAIFVTMIAHLFRSIPEYYFKRLQTQIERQAIAWAFTGRQAGRAQDTRANEEQD